MCMGQRETSHISQNRSFDCLHICLTHPDVRQLQYQGTPEWRMSQTPVPKLCTLTHTHTHTPRMVRSNAASRLGGLALVQRMLSWNWIYRIPQPPHTSALLQSRKPFHKEDPPIPQHSARRSFFAHMTWIFPPLCLSDSNVKLKASKMSRWDGCKTKMGVYKGVIVANLCNADQSFNCWWSACHLQLKGDRITKG